MFCKDFFYYKKHTNLLSVYQCKGWGEINPVVYKFLKILICHNSRLVCPRAPSFFSHFFIVKSFSSWLMLVLCLLWQCVPYYLGMNIGRNVSEGWRSSEVSVVDAPMKSLCALGQPVSLKYLGIFSDCSIDAVRAQMIGRFGPQSQTTTTSTGS